MKDLLSEKVCLITGAGRGIGQEIARCFAENGATVIANDYREGSVEEWLEQEEETVRQRITACYFDITDSYAVKENVMKLKRQFSRIDVLVNNAGVEYNELIGMISRANMEKMFHVNVFGMIEMLQYVSRVMARQKTGSIINIASIVGLRGNRGQLVYSATKGAVIAATKSAAKELAVDGIRVNAVAPGLTNTEMMQKANQSLLETRVKNIALGRIAEPRDIANACLFLASDLSGYVSGHILSVDGCAAM